MKKWVTILIFLLVGCEEIGAIDVPLDQVPQPAMKVAKEKLPEVKFEKAWKTRSGNFEVRGKTDKGKVRDIQVTPTGDVVEVD